MEKTFRQIGMERYLSRSLFPLSAGIALLLALLGPLTYWIIEHRNLQHMSSLYAEGLAEKFRQVALKSPTLWKYQTYDFMTIAEGFYPSIDVDSIRILDEKGEPISEFEYKSDWITKGNKLSFTEELGFTLGSAPIMFNNRRIGTVEVLACDNRLLWTTALLFGISSLVATALAVLGYQFPIRVVRKMEAEIEGLVSTLKQSEERLQSLLGNIPDVAWTSDREGNSTFLSLKTRDIVGYTPEEICASVGSLWFGNIHPDDRDRVTKAVENLFTAGAFYDEEYRYRRKDGTWIWLHDRAASTYERDGTLYADGLFSDITERKRMEEALRSATEFSRIVMDSINDAISIVDAGDYSIKGCNSGFLKKFGLTLEKVIGKECYKLTHHLSEPCRSPFDICPMKETIASGKYSVAEHTHVQANGDKFYAEVSTSPIFDGDGTVIKVVHISRDITERKLSEEKIRRLNDELELKVEEKTGQLLDAQEELVRKEKLATLGQLSGSVGHELRNPLGVMSNAIYFLKMVLTEADETTKEYLDIIKSEIENSQRIITDLLDFARTKPPQAKSVTAKELVGQSIGRCTIPEGVTLLSEVPETLPPLRVDPQQIGQVLHNLITNAIQAMPDGGALRVVARRVRSEESGERSANEIASPLTPHPSPLTPHPLPLTPYPSRDFVEISIEDSGGGISEADMNKIFQPLFTTKAKGIGLGLVVCRNLVEANGGRIEVESRSGDGATFTVTLPVGEE